MKYVFDACALVAYFNGEEGDDVVEKILLDPKAEIAMHAINLCEVYYGYARTNGSRIANNVLKDCLEYGIEVYEEMDPKLWKAAGDIKASYPLSLADAFVASLAKRLGATVVTSDHKEFTSLKSKKVCDVLFIRPPRR